MSPRNVVAKRRMPIQKNTGLRRMTSGKTVSLNSINRLMQEVRGFIVPIEIDAVPRKEQARRINILKLLLPRHDGATLARKRRIFVPAKFDVQKREWFLAWGCYQESLVMEAALKELGKSHRANLNPRVVLFKKEKTPPHVTVFFDFKGKTYKADTFNNTLTVVGESEIMSATILKKRVSSYNELARIRAKPQEEYPLGI